MLENRKFLKKTAQQMYEEEVKKHFFDLSDEKQIDVQVDHHLTQDDSVCVCVCLGLRLRGGLL
jgi:hypothetical protein